jgi:hypothetical protein
MDTIIWEQQILGQEGKPTVPKWTRFSAPYQSDDLASIDDLRPIQKPLAGGTVLQVDQTAPPDQKGFSVRYRRSLREFSIFGPHFNEMLTYVAYI